MGYNNYNNNDIYRKLQQARIEMQKKAIEKNKYDDYERVSEFMLDTGQVFNNIGLCGIISYTSDSVVLTIVNTYSDMDKDKHITFSYPIYTEDLNLYNSIHNRILIESYQKLLIYIIALELSVDNVLSKITSKSAIIENNKIEGTNNIYGSNLFAGKQGIGRGGYADSNSNIVWSTDAKI